MTSIGEISQYIESILEIDRFPDYCPNGLQVEGGGEIRRVIGGVSASRDVLAAAAARQAELVLVHHGLFWKGDSAVITGVKRQRLGLLLQHDINLLAYHLPLDAHASLGNNAGLGEALGLVVDGRFGHHDVGMLGHLPTSESAIEFAARLGRALGREPLHIAGTERPVLRVAWCTGGAQSWLDAAADTGADAFVTGEVSEQTWHTAMERGIHFFAAGHHATERFGVQRLGAHLAAHFGLEFEFVDVANPV